MNYKLLTFITVLMCGMSVSGQRSFQKVYGTGGDNYGNKVISNGQGFVIAGSSTSGAGGYDAILQGFDTAGVLQWTHEYGGGSTEYGSGLSNANGGYAVTGRTKSFSSNSSQDVYLLKTDYNGAPAWVQGYHTDSVDLGEAVTATQDGGYLLTGQTNAYSAGGNDMFVIKTDSNGNIQWSKNYGGTGNEVGNLILEMNGGGFVACGTTSSVGAGMNDVLLVIGDATGTPQLEVAIGGSGDEEGQGIANGFNNTAYILGTSGSLGQDKCFIACINTSTFSLNWAKVYGGSGSEQFSSVQQFQNGNMLITGSTTSFGNSNGSNGLVFEVDTAGTVLWATVVGDTGSTYLNNSLTLNDGSAIIVGSTDSFHLANHSDIYAARILANGALCSNSLPVSLTVTPWTPTVSVITSGISVDTVSFVTYVPGFTENSNAAGTEDLCASVTALVANAGRDTTLCSNANTTTLGGSPTAGGGVGPYTYQWSPSTGLSSATVSNPTATATTPTAYTVVVTDNLGTTASATVNVNVQICGGINDISAANFSIVPNPSNGNFVLDFANSNFNDAQINVYDVTGRTILADKVNNSSSMKLSLGNVPAGAYIIQITSAGQSATRKLIVE